MKALRAQWMFDGVSGDLKNDAVVLIENKRIVAIGSGDDVDVSEVSEIVDLGSRTLLPGLIDAHVHFGPDEAGGRYVRILEPKQRKLIRATVDARNALLTGFTTMRDVAGSQTVHLRDAIRDGDILGPRILAAGLAISSTGGIEDPNYLPSMWLKEINHIVRIAGGPVDCREAVREQVRLGADFIKLLATNLGDVPQFTRQEIEAVIDEAHRLGMRVAVHANGGPALKDALLAGADTIEHGPGLDEEDLEYMQKNRTSLVPTFAITRRMIEEGLRQDLSDDALRTLREREESTARAFLKALDAGVKVVCGSDFGMRHFTRHGSNALELELMVDAGCNPDYALTTATKNAAEALGLGDKIGTLEVGKNADIIAVREDPTNDIRAIYDVDFVMKDGLIHKKPDDRR